MSEIQVFVSFDIEHDEDLYDLLLSQSTTTGFDFAVLGGSVRSTATDVRSEDVGSERVRRWIRAADQVIVICGEHTESSMRVSAELRIAQEERTPYILLWGRREIMCTKPIGARRGLPAGICHNAHIQTCGGDSEIPSFFALSTRRTARSRRSAHGASPPIAATSASTSGCT